MPELFVPNTLSSKVDAEYSEMLRQQDGRLTAECAQLHEDNLRSEQARTRANRQNARFSTGPRTLTGKEISCLNATRHGLTGRAVLLPSEDAEAYSHHVERFRRDHAPATERELELTQMLADTQWRLNRIPGLESGVYAMGRQRYVDLYLDVQDAALRSQLIDVYTMEQSGKELRNLSLQEGRLRRQYASDLKELKALQSERLEKEKQQPQPASSPKIEKTTATAPGQDPHWVRFYDEANTPNNGLSTQASKPESADKPTSTEGAL